MDRIRPTIADVAKRAGVSVGTVSHVLSDRIKVSTKLKARVQIAIDELGFIPNFHAQGLRRALSGVIGVCFPHTNTVYLNALSEELEKIAARAGYSVMHVFSRQDAEAELRRIKELLRLRVDGVLLFPALASKTFDLLYDSGVPTVLIDRAHNDDRFDQVVLDARKSMTETAERLMALGHRNLLLVCTSRRFHIVRQRTDALVELRNRVPGLIAEWIEFEDDVSLLKSEVWRRLKSEAPPSVIIASNSPQAALMVRMLNEIGTRVPDEVSLITFDEPDWAEIVSPPLSVIRQPTAEIARLSWDLLVRRMKGEGGPPTRLKLESEIAFRKSVAAPHQSNRRIVSAAAR